MSEYQTAWLIDVTSMENIARYLHNDTRIDAIIDVKGNDLAQIGDIAFLGKLEEWRELLKTGSVQIFWAVRQINVPLHYAVDCIRLEPFYFIKSRNQVYK